MRLFKGFIRLIKGVSIETEPKLILNYGQYGGGGYGGGYAYDRETMSLYKKSSSGNFVFEKLMTEDEYVDFFIENARQCEPIDDLDACFKLHDIDGSTTEFMKILKFSHNFPVNMAKIDPFFYVFYPLAVITGLIYFYTIGKQPESITPEKYANIMTLREELRAKYSEKFSVEYI